MIYVDIRVGHTLSIALPKSKFRKDTYLWQMQCVILARTSPLLIQLGKTDTSLCGMYEIHRTYMGRPIQLPKVYKKLTKCLTARLRLLTPLHLVQPPTLEEISSREHAVRHLVVNGQRRRRYKVVPSLRSGLRHS